MTLFLIFFAVIENDLRRVLAYSLNNQLGFMVVGIGIGTALSLNGTVAHLAGNANLVEERRGPDGTGVEAVAHAQA